MFDTTEVLSHISFILVFVEGVLSFFSPCVLPLVPMYMGYLAGSHNQNAASSKKKVLAFTLCFILGIFTAIFCMNLGISVLSSFFKEHMAVFIKLGGILIILLGIHQLGFVRFQALERTFKIPMQPQKAMNVLVAFLMGFTFSFAWTPCIGPALSSILLLAGSSQSFFISNALMLIYALGFTIPFLLVGIFTDTLLQWMKKHTQIVKYTVKLGAVIMIFMGVMMFTGNMNTISNYISPAADDTTENQQKELSQEELISQLLAYTFYDQHGNTVALQDYKSKVVFLNFWATWCPPCQNELPYIQQLSTEYQDHEDVQILTVVLPNGNMGQEKDEDGLRTYLKEHGYTMPVLFDDGTLTSFFQVNSLPTTYMLEKGGTPYGYVKGELSYDMMKRMIEQTLQNAR